MSSNKTEDSNASVQSFTEKVASYCDRCNEMVDQKFPERFAEFDQDTIDTAARDAALEMLINAAAKDEHKRKLQQRTEQFCDAQLDGIREGAQEWLDYGAELEKEGKAASAKEWELLDNSPKAHTESDAKFAEEWSFNSAFWIAGLLTFSAGGLYLAWQTTTTLVQESRFLTDPSKIFIFSSSVIVAVAGVEILGLSRLTLESKRKLQAGLSTFAICLFPIWAWQLAQVTGVIFETASIGGPAPEDDGGGWRGRLLIFTQLLADVAVGGSSLLAASGIYARHQGTRLAEHPDHKKHRIVFEEFAKQQAFLAAARSRLQTKKHGFDARIAVFAGSVMSKFDKLFGDWVRRLLLGQADVEAKRSPQNKQSTNRLNGQSEPSSDDIARGNGHPGKPSN